MNYYDIFGISPTASSEDINAAHKALAKLYHPDINSSKDAHEKMTQLNKANEVLSDNTKRRDYDNYLKSTQRRERNRDRSTQSAKPNTSRGMRDTDERAGKAELLRKKTEARLKNVDSAQMRRKKQVEQKDDSKFQKIKQIKADADKQHVLNVLSKLVMDGNAEQSIKTQADEERHSATKVLLSMVRKNDDRLRIMAEKAEEAERKQRIEEILSLVNEINSDEEKFV